MTETITFSIAHGVYFRNLYRQPVEFCEGLEVCMNQII